jgi:hypothetical protein
MSAVPNPVPPSHTHSFCLDAIAGPATSRCAQLTAGAGAEVEEEEEEAPEVPVEGRGWMYFWRKEAATQAPP